MSLVFQTSFTSKNGCSSASTQLSLAETEQLAPHAETETHAETFQQSHKVMHDAVFARKVSPGLSD